MKYPRQRWVALALALGGLILVGAIGAGLRWQSNINVNTPVSADDLGNSALNYGVVPSANGRYEAADFAAQEAYWFDRTTYPTGNYNRDWVNNAAKQDAKIERAVPEGKKATVAKDSPLALDPNGFTAIGPVPLRMTGCSGCYNYTATEGRVNVIVVDPVVTSTAFFGSDGGGVWKTTNCCSASTSWQVVTDDPLLSTISIDDITIDPSNHNVIYAGTGDLNYGSFSAGSAGILKSTDGGYSWSVKGASVFGPGLPEPAGQFPQYESVGKVRVDPNHNNIVLAGSKQGLWLSYDGGDNWTGPCTTNAFSTMRQDITGLVLTNIGGTTRIIAAIGVRGFATTVQYNLDMNGANGLYKGTVPASGCPTDFVSISNDSNFNATAPAALNLHATSGTKYASSGVGNQLGRVDIAVAPSNPNYIYAQVQSITPINDTGCGNTNGCQLGVWRTTDGGTTWTQLANSNGLALRNCSNTSGDYPQNWYDQMVAVDPSNPDRAFISTFDIFFWVNGAANLNDTTCGYDGTSGRVVHVDQHALAFVPDNPNIMLAGSDGGVFVTLNANTASATVDPTWNNIDNGVNTIEFYSGDIAANTELTTTVYANGGAQDNGSSSVKFTSPITGPVQWQMGTGGDGFFARIDPISLHMWQGGNSGGLTKCFAADCTASGTSWPSGGARGNWTGDTQSFVLPYEIFKGTPGNTANDCKPSGCDHMIAGTTRVWEITDANNPTTNVNTYRALWHVNSPTLVKGILGNRSFINQLTYAPSLSTTAAVATNDGAVQYGFGLGTSTTVSVTATWVDVTGGNAILPNRPILDIAIAPNNPLTAYAAVGGFNANTPSTTGHVFRVVCTTNCASFTWTNKTGNLPDIPVDSIMANPKYPSQVFAGTDFGLYFTNNINAVNPIWQRFQAGVPNVMIWDMSIDRQGNLLSLWTRSRGAYVWPLPSSPLSLPSPTASPTATPISAQNVAWTDIVGVTPSGNSITKTGPDGAWDSGAVSTKQIASGDGFVQETVADHTSYVMFGLGNGDTSQDYTDIDYAIYPYPNTNELVIYENGAYMASVPGYSIGDVLKVSVESGVVKYYQNGGLIYTSAAAPTYPLRLDTSIFSNGGTISNAQIYGYNLTNVVANTPTVTATATNTPVPVVPAAVNWIDQQAVSASSNTITKVGANTAWDAGAASDKQIPSGPGYVQQTLADTTNFTMFGLSNGDSNVDYTDIDYAIYTYPNTNELAVYENGVYRTSISGYSIGDVLKVAVNSGVVTYLKNGVVFYTSGVAPSYPLLLDSSIFSTGGQISNAFIAGQSLTSVTPWTPTPTATATNTPVPLACEAVSYINPVLVSVSGNTITKSSGGNAWNAGAISSKAINSGSGYIEETVSNAFTYTMFGLGDDDNAGTYTSINYGIYTYAGANELWVYESGAYRGTFTTYTVGDVLRVSVSGGVVTYAKNGSVFYTSSVAASYPLLLNGSIFTPAGQISNAQICGTDLVLNQIPPIKDGGVTTPNEKLPVAPRALGQEPKEPARSGKGNTVTGSNKATPSRPVMPSSKGGKSEGATGANSNGPSRPIVPSNGSYRDVPAGSWAFDAVRWASAKLPLSGYSCGNGCRAFRPDQHASRAQVVKLLVAAAGIPVATSGQHFADVPASHPFYGWIEAAAQRGLVSGVSNKGGLPNFQADNVATRAQLAKLVVLAAGWSLEKPAASFKDVPANNWASGYIATAVAHKVVSGYKDGSFQPDALVTRGQLVVMLYNAFGK